MKKSVYTLVLVIVLCSLFIIQNCQAQWTQSNGPYTGAIKSLLVSGSTIFAGVDGVGAFEGSSFNYTGISTDNGQNWSQISSSSGLRCLNVNSFAEISPNIFAGTDSGVFRSTNNGANWMETSSGITNKKINTLFVHGSNIYAGTLAGIFLSANNGSSWSPVNSGLTYQYIFGFTSIGTNICVATNGGVFMSTNNGGTWASIGLSNLYVLSITSIGNNLFAGTYGAGIYLSTNNGGNWTSINNGLLNYNVYSFGVSGTNLYSGTEGGVFYTSNNGTSWSTSGITDQKVNTIFTSGINVFTGTQVGGVFKSTNNGINWANSSKGLYTVCINKIVKYGSNIFCGSDKGFFLSTDNGFHWERRNAGFGANGINNVNVTGLYNKNGVLFSTVWGYFYNGVDPFGGGVFKSTNDGLQWISCYNIHDSLAYRKIIGINGIGNSMFVSLRDWGMERSTNDGYSWRLFCIALNSLPPVSNGTYLFSGTLYPDFSYPPVGIFRFNENTLTFINTGLTSKIFHSLAVEGNTLFAGTDTGRIFKSTNLGESWVLSNNGIPNNTTITSLAISGQNIFAGTQSHGLYLSKDGGNTWTLKNDGFEFPVAISVIYLSGSDVFLGTTSQSVWRRSLSELLGVQNISSEVPTGYSLGQNYPNPFNSTSNLKFEISKLGDVKIVVYDVQGRKVQTLVNERLQAGTYEVKFDGSMLPSGVYFYKLSVRHGGSSIGDFSETKKLILLK